VALPGPCPSPQIGETVTSIGRSLDPCREALNQIDEQKAVNSYATQNSVALYEKAIDLCRHSELLIVSGALENARRSQDLQTAASWYDMALDQVSKK
jgi:hypothetical protein